MVKKLLCVLSLLFLFCLTVFSNYYFKNNGLVTASNVANSSGEFYLLNYQDYKSVIKSKSQTAKVTKQEVLTIINTLNAKKISNFTLNDITEEYFYTPEVSNYVIINNKKVNIHVVKTDEIYQVGIPFIFYGY